MADEIKQPLLSLLHGQGCWTTSNTRGRRELQRNAAPAIQVLQDFGIMKLDDILHVEATRLARSGAAEDARLRRTCWD